MSGEHSTQERVMNFSASVLLKTKQQYLEVIPSTIITPRYNSRTVVQQLGGNFDVFCQLPKYAARLFKEVPVLKPESHPRNSSCRFVCGGNERTKNSWVVPPRMKVEDVWTLMGYLAEVGPLPVHICAQAPFNFEGALFEAFWTDLLAHEGIPWALYLLRCNSRLEVKEQIYAQSVVLLSDAR